MNWIRCIVRTIVTNLTLTLQIIRTYEVCLIPSAVLDNASDPMNLGICQYGLCGLVLVARVRVDLAPLIRAQSCCSFFLFLIIFRLHGAFQSRHAVFAQCTSCCFECTYVRMYATTLSMLTCWWRPSTCVCVCVCVCVSHV